VSESYVESLRKSHSKTKHGASNLATSAANMASSASRESLNKTRKDKHNGLGALPAGERRMSQRQTNVTKAKSNLKLFIDSVDKAYE